VKGKIPDLKFKPHSMNIDSYGFPESILKTDEKKPKSLPAQDLY
jgi:hypothetical protein